MLEVVKLSQEVLTWPWDRVKPIGVAPTADGGFRLRAKLPREGITPVMA